MRKEQLDGEDIFLIHDFLGEAECAAAVARAEAAGFAAAPITTAAGPVLARGVRDNGRVLLADPDEAARLFARARPLLPAARRGWELTGFNEHWRYYRYDRGERFRPHYDGHFERGPGERSQLTFLIYLNDNFQGGETNFYPTVAGPFDEEPYLSVRPARGAALVFVHWKLHEGAAVLAGRKYVQRTDVMYRQRAEVGGG